MTQQYVLVLDIAEACENMAMQYRSLNNYLHYSLGFLTSSELCTPQTMFSLLRPHFIGEGPCMNFRTDS